MVRTGYQLLVLFVGVRGLIARTGTEQWSQGWGTDPISEASRRGNLVRLALYQARGLLMFTGDAKKNGRHC